MAKESIVVIDSEPMVREVITAILEGVGYRVRATGEFEAALKMVRSEPPDLLITNVFLTGSPGPEIPWTFRLEHLMEKMF